MAEIKDKVVTVESLSMLHEDNKKSYAAKNNPVVSGTMTVNGDTNISGAMNAGSLLIGSKIKLVPTENALEIVFL